MRHQLDCSVCITAGIEPPGPSLNTKAQQEMPQMRCRTRCDVILFREYCNLSVGNILCRRPSAVVNLNCVTNRVAPRSRYKLSYNAE